jgi:hypothetical protein
MKEKEKALEGEVVIKKVDSDGFVYYETLENQSTPNWENLNRFLQKIPVKELIIGTVVFSILLLFPDVTWAKLKPSKFEQEQLIKSREFLDAARQKRGQAKKVVSMKKIIMWNEKLVEFEPTTTIVKYIIQFVSGQINTYRLEKMNRLALIEQTKQLENIANLLKINGGFMAFSAISQAIELGKSLLFYFEKNKNSSKQRRYKKNNDDFLWAENPSNSNRPQFTNFPNWIILLIALLAWQKGGETLSRIRDRLVRSSDPIISSVGNLLNNQKKSNKIVSFIKNRPLFFMIGTFGVIAGTVIIVREVRKLDSVKNVENSALNVLRETINHSYSAFGQFMNTQTNQFQQLWDTKVKNDTQQKKSFEIDISTSKKENGAFATRLENLRKDNSELQILNSVSNTQLKSCVIENQVLRDGITQYALGSDQKLPGELISGDNNILDVPSLPSSRSE